MKADLFSLIKWNENLDEAPTDDLLIIYKDDSGDYINYYTMVAWKTSWGGWISNDEELYFPNIVCWSELPKYENMKVFG